MKWLMTTMLLISCLQTFAGIQSKSNSGVLWNVNITDEGLSSSVYNNSNAHQVCSVGYNVSLLNEFGMVKGIKNLRYDNYIILSRNNYEFKINQENISVKGDIVLGEIVGSDPLICRPLNGGIEEVKNAVEGALRNSDEETSKYFFSMAQDTSKIKVLNVSNSHFNLSDIKGSLELNFIEIEKTTFFARNTPEDAKLCSEKQSLKCGADYFTDATSNCGIARYNRRENKACGCATREGGPCMGGCGCKTYKTCEHPSFGVAAYKACAHPAHGVLNAKSCLLKLNSAGVFESCQQN